MEYYIFLFTFVFFIGGLVFIAYDALSHKSPKKDES